MKQHEALETVRAVGLAINHVQNLLLHRLAHGVTSRPVVSSSSAAAVDVEVLGVVDVLVRACLDAIEDLCPVQRLVC